MATPVEQFIASCSQLAVRYGLKIVLVGAADPVTGAVKVAVSPGTVENPAMKAAVVEKLGLQLSGSDDDLNDSVEVGWNDSF